MEDVKQILNTILSEVKEVFGTDLMPVMGRFIFPNLKNPVSALKRLEESPEKIKMEHLDRMERFFNVDSLKDLSVHNDIYMLKSSAGCHIVNTKSLSITFESVKGGFQTFTGQGVLQQAIKGMAPIKESNQINIF